MWCDGSPARQFPANGLYNYAGNWNENHIEICLNNDKSGALLAWEYFHPLEEAPKLIQHIDDRDRWQFKLKGSKELHAALASHKPWSFEQWNTDFMDADGAIDTRTDTLSGLYEEGAAILRAQEANVTSMAKQARKCRIEQPVAGGARLSLGEGLACNAPLHQSELGHVLATRSGTYGLIWYLAEDNRVKCSLRSNGDYDVSAIAKAFGGGGHRNAAGFETDIQTLLTWL
jgi:oligoribonuclease NrnB/cAMP/cGMP phosphodiesterase (DHH superfamily)